MVKTSLGVHKFMFWQHKITMLPQHKCNIVSTLSQHKIVSWVGGNDGVDLCNLFKPYNWDVIYHQVAPNNNLFFLLFSSISQWFLNLLSKQTKAAITSSSVWFRRFKNHWLRIEKMTMELFCQNLYCWPLLFCDFNILNVPHCIFLISIFLATFHALKSYLNWHVTDDKTGTLLVFIISGTENVDPSFYESIK